MVARKVDSGPGMCLMVDSGWFHVDHDRLRDADRFPLGSDQCDRDAVSSSIHISQDELGCPGWVVILCLAINVINEPLIGRESNVDPHVDDVLCIT